MPVNVLTKIGMQTCLCAGIPSPLTKSTVHIHSSQIRGKVGNRKQLLAKIWERTMDPWITPWQRISHVWSGLEKQLLGDWRTHTQTHPYIQRFLRLLARYETLCNCCLTNSSKIIWKAISTLSFLSIIPQAYTNTILTRAQTHSFTAALCFSHR